MYEINLLLGAETRRSYALWNRLCDIPLWWLPDGAVISMCYVARVPFDAVMVDVTSRVLS